MKCFYVYTFYTTVAVSHNFSLVHVTLSQSVQQSYLIIVIFRAQIPVHTHTLTFSRSKKVRFSNSNVVVTLTACIHVQVNMVISGLNHRCRTQILLLICRIHNGLCLLTQSTSNCFTEKYNKTNNNLHVIKIRLVKAPILQQRIKEERL